MIVFFSLCCAAMLTDLVVLLQCYLIGFSSSSIISQPTRSQKDLQRRRGKSWKCYWWWRRTPQAAVCQCVFRPMSTALYPTETRCRLVGSEPSTQGNCALRISRHPQRWVESRPKRKGRPLGCWWWWRMGQSNSSSVINLFWTNSKPW